MQPTADLEEDNQSEDIEEEGEQGEDEEEGEDEEQEKPSDSPFFHLDLSHIKVRCDVCNLKKGHLACKNCKIGRFCSADCQKKGWSVHKSYCKQMKQLWDKFYEEEEKLRHCDDNFSGVLMNYFEDPVCIGSFWGLHETRPFCRSLMNVVTVCQNYRTPAAIKQAILLVMRLLYLCRGDNMGARYLAPHYFVQIGEDQLAYDFIKYWEEDPWDGDGVSAPYLHYWHSDLSEPAAHLSKSNCLEHSVACLLIKLRYFEKCLAREAFQKAFLLGSMRSGNILSRLGGNGLVLRLIYSFYLAPSSFASRSVRNSEAMHSQVKEKLRCIDNYCPLMIKALANPHPIVAMPKPSMYSRASAEEVYFTLHNAYPGWSENAFAIEYVREHCRKVYGTLDYTVKPSRF